MVLNVSLFWPSPASSAVQTNETLDEYSISNTNGNKREVVGTYRDGTALFCALATLMGVLLSCVGTLSYWVTIKLRMSIYENVRTKINMAGNYSSNLAVDIVNMSKSIANWIDFTVKRCLSSQFLSHIFWILSCFLRHLISVAGILTWYRW